MIRLSDISVSQIQVFLHAAESLNFTRTAEAFSLTQSAVSKMTAGLEHAVGTPLFLRRNNRLTLTAAGSYLSGEWAPLARGFERSLRDAARIAARSDTVSFGIPDSLREEALTPYLDAFYAAERSVQVVFHVLAANLLVPKLASGELDCIVTGVYERDTLSSLGFETKYFLSLPDVAFLRNDNPLARRDSLSLRDLRDEPIQMIAPSENAAYFEKIYRLFAEVGLTPHFQDFAPNFRSMMRNLIRNGRGVVISNEWIADADHPSLVRFSLPDTAAGMIVAWPGRTPNPAVRLLADSFPSAE